MRRLRVERVRVGSIELSASEQKANPHSSRTFIDVRKVISTVGASAERFVARAHDGNIICGILLPENHHLSGFSIRPEVRYDAAFSTGVASVSDRIATDHATFGLDVIPTFEKDGGFSARRRKAISLH